MKKRKKLRGKSLLALMLMAALVLQPLSVGAEEINVPEETALAETVTEDVNVTEDVTEDVAAVPDAEAEEPALSETVTGDEAGQKDFKSYDNGGSIVVLIDDKCEYKGSEVKPVIQVWDVNDELDGKELKEGTDFSVTYSNNDKPGKATATLTGMGDYKPQSIKESFLIYEPVAETDLTVVPSGTYFTVTNNRKDLSLYVLFVSETDDTAVTGEAREGYVFETVEIPAGKTKEVSYSIQLKNAENAEFARIPVAKNTQYILKASVDEYFQYSKPDLEVKKEAEHTNGEEPGTDYKNGYDEAGMTAAVQKNGTVKLAWKPKVKEEKFFALFQRDANDSEWKKIWPDTVGTVAEPGTLDNKKTWSESYNAFSENQKEPKNLEVYLLVCGTAKTGGNVIGKYIAPVAPYLLDAETDLNPQNEEMTFSYMPGTDNLKYRLQVAGANKEKSDKVPEGYQDAWSTDCVSDELYSFGDWNLSKTVTLQAARTSYLNAQPVKTAGKTYYNRVRMIYTFGGKDYISAPSNVISRKTAPGKVYSFSAVGLKHDAKNNEQNRQYAQDYIDYFKYKEDLLTDSVVTGDSDISVASSEAFGEVYAEEGEVTSGEEIDDAKAEVYRELAADSFAAGEGDAETPDFFAHKKNTSTETKNGYVFFYVKKDSSIELKGFELLKSTVQYGTYTKTKAYNMPGSNVKDVWKLSVTEDNLFYWDGYDIYCVWYNNFPPEQTMYYAVRAVAKNGSAPGGYGDGIENTGSLDAVQNLDASVDSSVSITTTWDHDDCAKQYFVYRSKTGFDPFSPDEEFRPEGWEFNEQNYVQIATVSGSAKKTDKSTGRIYNTYVDKGNYKDKSLPFEEEKYYAYVVKPVYDTKKAKDFNYNKDLASDPWPGMLSISNADVKNFSAANYCAGTIMLKWKDDKKMDIFGIQRAEGGAYSNPESIPDSAWTTIGTMKSQKGASMLEFPDSKATIGVNYYYRIRAGKEHSGAEPSWSKWTYFKTKVKSVPLPVVGAKAVANGANKGARVTWSLNAKDKEAYSLGECVVLIKWSDSNGSSVGYRKTANNTSYIDSSYLAPDVKRTYTIAVDYKGTMYSPVSVSYKIASGTIALYYDNGTPVTTGSLDLTKESWAPLLGNVVSGGQVLTGVSVAATSSNTGVVEVSAAQSGNYTKFSLHCKSPGQAIVTFSAQGAPSRSLIINVK